MFFQRQKKKLVRKLWSLRVPPLSPQQQPQKQNHYNPAGDPMDQDQQQQPHNNNNNNNNNRHYPQSQCPSQQSSTTDCVTLRRRSTLPLSRRNQNGHGGPDGIDCTSSCTEQQTPPPPPPENSTTTTAGAAYHHQLWQYCCSQQRSGSVSSNNSSANMSVVAMDVEEDMEELYPALVNMLKPSQLETLITAIEESISGGQQTDCVLVMRYSSALHGYEPNVIACRSWRWPDISGAHELKGVPACPNKKDPVYVCCNPSHYSRHCRPDTPPPPYQSSVMKQTDSKGHTRIDDLGPTSSSSSPCSLTTDGEELSNSTNWCQLAYWEMAQRVGRRFPVDIDKSTINIFAEQPRGDGLCLTTLAQGSRLTKAPESVLKARQKIGLGVTLSREADGIWLYNRSVQPVFVHSPTLQHDDADVNEASRTVLVCRVPPGYCLRAFDLYRAATQTYVWPAHIPGAQVGPVDTHSVRISFAKGWGPKYSRQEVTGCPCWLEVLITRGR